MIFIYQRSKTGQSVLKKFFIKEINYDLRIAREKDVFCAAEFLNCILILDLLMDDLSSNRPRSRL